MQILLVMENTKTLNALEQYVKKCYPNNTIVSVTKAKEALEFIKTSEEPVGLCFTAVLMEDVSGLKVVEELRRRNRLAKAVLVAADDRFALDGWKVGMNDYLIEPLTIESVRHTLVSCAGT